MNIGDKIHGFILEEVREARDISAVANFYRHTSGLRCLYLKREDENKLFSIAFPTYPTDNTGVFHIIEHSLLCGSDKYPVKEPFAELLKSSLKTLLNAYTYKDKTVFPVASRNEGDFFNLVEVYLDAVFHPRLLSDKNIFLREGHRLEPTEDGGYRINGVVYNEMQSGECSVGEVAERELSRLLFPDSSYSFVSGGDASAIPSLTYEKLLEVYKKHYNPAFAHVVIDGEVDIERTLSLIDASIDGITPGEDAPCLVLNKDTDTVPRTAYYQISEGEDRSTGARVFASRRVCSVADRKKIYAISVLCDALAGANGSPLRKRMLDTGLCDGFSMGIDDGGAVVTLTAELRGVKPSDTERAVGEYRRLISSYVNNTLPKEDIEASLLSMEFKTREADSGSSPVGYIYSEAVYGTWLYGFDALAGLSFSEIFESLKEGLRGDYFERLLCELLDLDEAVLYLLPSDSFEKELAAERADLLKERFSALTEKDKQVLKEENEHFLAWQEKPDSREDLDRIPRLILSELQDEKKDTPKTVKTIDGVETIFCEIDTRGIVYTDLYFDISDCRDVGELFVLTLLFSEMSTTEGSDEYMRQRIKKNLGSLGVSLLPVKRKEETRLYLAVRSSALMGQRDKLISLLKEYIYTGKLPSIKKITRKLSQLSRSLLSSITYSPIGAALSYLGASVDELGTFGEAWYGVTALHRYREMAKEPFKTKRKLKRLLKKIQREYLVKERMTLGITGSADTDFAIELIGAVKNGDGRGEVYKRQLLKKENVGMLLPSNVSTIIRGGLLPENYELSEGEQAVFGTMLDYEILWNEIRLKGGAYDTGCVLQPRERLISLYSSSEPDVKRADSIFRNIGEFTGAFLKGLDGGFEGYIIGALGETEPLLSPKQRGAYEFVRHLSGKTREDEIRKRKELLAFDKTAFGRCAEALSGAMSDSVFIAVGSAEVLSTLPVDRIIKI